MFNRNGSTFPEASLDGTRIRIGIVGLSAEGWASRAHVPALKDLGGYELRALCTTSAESAKLAAARYGVPLFFAAPAELAACPDVDLVVVAIRIHEHKRAVTAAIEAGKHVYCEWPLGNGLAEAEEMAALASARGVRAFAGLQARSSPTIRYIRDLVSSGYVGKVLSTSMVAAAGAWGMTIEPRAIYALDRRNGASLLTIQFSHAADAMCWCLGEFREISATLAIRSPMAKRTDTGEMIPKTIHDQIAVNGILEGGAVASMHYRADLTRGKNFLWEINGTEGDIVVSGDLGRLQYGEFRIEGASAGQKTLSELAVPESYKLAPGSARDTPYTLSHAYLRVLADLRDGTREVPGFGEAVVRHRMIDAIERAAAAGRSQSYDRTIP